MFIFILTYWINDCWTIAAPLDHGDPHRITNAVHTALGALKVSYIDLFLIHWPGKSGIPESSSANSQLRSDTWKTLVELKSRGLLRSIGVSNFNIKHLEQLLANCYGTKPAVNQVSFLYSYCILRARNFTGIVQRQVFIMRNIIAFSGRMSSALQANWTHKILQQRRDIRSSLFLSGHWELQVFAQGSCSLSSCWWIERFASQSFTEMGFAAKYR